METLQLKDFQLQKTCPVIFDGGCTDLDDASHVETSDFDSDDDGDIDFDCDNETTQPLEELTEVLTQKFEDGMEVTSEELRRRIKLVYREEIKAKRKGDRVREDKLYDVFFAACERRDEQEKKIQEEADKIKKKAEKIKAETEALSEKTDADQHVLEKTEFLKNMSEEILEEKKRLSQKNVGWERTGKHKTENTSVKETYRDIQIHLKNITGLVQEKMQNLSEEVRKRLELFMSAFQKLLAGIWKLLFIVLMLNELENLFVSLKLGDIYTARRKRRQKYGFKMAAMLALWLSHDVESNPGPLFNNRTCMEMLVRQLSQNLRTKLSVKGTLWSKSVAKKANEAGYPRWLHWKNPSGKNKNSTPQLVKRARKLGDILRKHNSLPSNLAHLVDQLETDGNTVQLRIYFELENFRDAAGILLQEQDLRTTHKESICKMVEELTRKCGLSDIPSTEVCPGNFAALADRSETNLLPTSSQVSATSAKGRNVHNLSILTKPTMENGSSPGCSGCILDVPASPLNIPTAESDHSLETDDEVTNTVLSLEHDFNSTPISAARKDILDYLKMPLHSRRSSDGGTISPTFQTGHDDTINDDTRTTTPISPARDEDTIQHDVGTTSPTFQTGHDDTRTFSPISPARDEDTIQHDVGTTSPTFQTGHDDTRTTSLISPVTDEDTIQYGVGTVFGTFQTGHDETIHDHTVSGDDTGTASMKAQSQNEEETEHGTTSGNSPTMNSTQKVTNGGSLNEDDTNYKTNSQETQNLAFVECSQSSATLSSLPDNQSSSNATQDQDNQHAIFGESDDNIIHHEDTCHDDTTNDTSSQEIDRSFDERPENTTREEEQTRENSNLGTYFHQSSQGRSNLPDEENVDQEDVFNGTLTEQSMDQSSDDDSETQLDDDSQTTCDEEEWLRFKTQNQYRLEKVIHEMFLTFTRSKGQQASKLKMKPSKQLKKIQNMDRPDSSTVPGTSIYTGGRKRRGQEEIRSAKKKREGNKTEDKKTSSVGERIG